MSQIFASFAVVLRCFIFGEFLSRRDGGKTALIFCISFYRNLSSNGYTSSTQYENVILLPSVFHMKIYVSVISTHKILQRPLIQVNYTKHVYNIKTIISCYHQQDTIAIQIFITFVFITHFLINDLCNMYTTVVTLIFIFVGPSHSIHAMSTSLLLRRFKFEFNTI